MPNTATLNSLVSLVRTRGDVVGSSSFDDNVELKPWIRNSLAQLNELLVQRFQDFYAKSVAFSLIANQEMYALPSDFRLLQECYVFTGPTFSRQRLTTFNTEEYYGGPIPYASMQYRVMRNSIYFTPTPTITAYNAVSILYTPQYRPPLLDYSPIDEVFPNGWEEWAVLDVLQKMNVKVRLLNMDDILKSKAMVEDRVIRAAFHRTSEAPRMRNRWQAPPCGAMPSGPGPLYWAAP